VKDLPFEHCMQLGRPDREFGIESYLLESPQSLLPAAGSKVGRIPEGIEIGVVADDAGIWVVMTREVPN
jgi:hypothetical protein